MADFWKRNGFTVKDDEEEKDREKNNLSFWARYGVTDKEPESTLPSRTAAEPAEDSFLGRLAQRGVTIELPEPEKKVDTPARTGTSLLAGGDQAARAATDIFRNRLGTTFTAQQMDNSNRKKAVEDLTAADKQQHEDYVSSLRKPEEIQADIDAAKTELSDARKKWWRDEFLAWGGGIEGRTRTLEENDARNAEIKDRIASLENELRVREGAEKYDSIRYKADFAQKSKARELTVKERVDDPLYAYVNGDKASASLLMDPNDTVHGKDNLVVEQMTPDEVRTFNYLHATEGKDAAEEYVEFLRPDLNARNMEAVKNQVANFTGQNLGTKILGSVGSIAMTPLRGLAYAGQFADYATTGKVDPNAPYNMYSAIPTAARETVSKDIERKWGTWGSFAYQTGMSMADFLLNSAVAGGSEALSLTIMGTGAAADATISAKERGLDDTQSFVIGTIAGLAEAVSEKVSFEKLFKQADWREQPVKYILQNFFFEGSEEVESDAMNWLADAIVARDKSEWQADIDAYKAENPNATDNEAFWNAVKQRAIEGGMDFLGGAISGGLMASGRVAFDRAANRAQRSRDKSQAIEAVREARQARTPAPVSAQQAAQTQESSEERIPLPTADDMMGADDASGEDSVIRMGAEPEPGLKTDEQLETEKRIANARNITEATGIKYGADEALIRKAERYGRLTGDTVEFYLEEGKNGTKQNGFYDPTNRRIYYNVNATKPFEFTFGHEFTHTTENTDAYRALSELVEQRIMESGRDITEEVQKIIDRYRRAGITLTEEQARQEIVADWIGENLSDERTIREISRDKASVAKQIRDGLDSFITRAADMSGIITSYEEQKYRNIVGLYDKYLGRIEEARVRQAETEAEPVQSAKERNRERLNALSENWSGIKKGDLGRSVNEIYQTAKTTLERTADGGYNVTSGNAEKVFAQARKIAADLIADANIREDNELFRQYEEPRKYLRETPIHYDRARMVAELGGEEEFKAWRDSMRGILNLTAKEGSGIPVDTVFDEFAEQWPGNVDLTVIQDTDRIQELARTAQYMREQERSNYVNPYAQNREEAEGQLAAAIYSEAVERLLQSEKPKQTRPRTQPKTTQTQRAEQTALTRKTASQTEENGDESVEEFRARIERMYEAGEITQAEYEESMAAADEAESTGRGFSSSTVERDEGPVGKIPALVRNVRDRATGRQYSISVDEDESRKNAKTALEYFGKTYSWRETGYITRDGDRIDFSGKRNGAPAGHRSMDHREISDALGDDYGDGTYSGAMVQFMREGNIRISPESGGINLMAEPTEQQYKQLEAFIQNNRGEVILDIDDEDGYTIESREYDRGTRSSHVLNDIRGYFEDGALPEEPDNRYSVSETDDEAYIDAVEAGDTETAQRMVDEAARAAGYLIRAFHGTPNGTFTVFRNWQYFTEDRSYADVYQKQGASSNGYKRTALNPKTYAVFIDPKNAFDTRNARDREIFENEFFGRYGNGTPLSERGLPDWTDGDDLIEFFEDNGYDYDAFYLDEGGTGGFGQEVNDRGISIVVKDSAQIKSADPVTYDDDGNVIPLSERFNPVQEDIRYSITEADDEAYMDAVEAGDTETAQRMVDEAARDAGYNSPKLYHGTDYYKQINIFKPGKSGYLGPGIYLTPNESLAKRYADRSGDGGRIYSAWAKIQNPLNVTSDEPAREILREITGSDRVFNNRMAKQAWSTQILTKADMNKLRAKGYDGIIWKYGMSPAEYMVFESSQIKSADPVTYDDDGNVIPLSERFNPVQEDIRYSITETDDEAYIDAVEAGDTETAQRMVDEAAKRAGYTDAAYHGTNEFGFTVIDVRRSDDKTSFFVSDSEETAKTYSGKSGARHISERNGDTSGNYKFYINTEGMLRIDGNGRNWNRIPLGRMVDQYNKWHESKGYGRNIDAMDGMYRTANTRQIAAFAMDQGYRGVEFDNIVDNGIQAKRSVPASTVYALFNPTEQAKSADPVTYDDEGNVIPLSERFNPVQEDIRYSITEADDEAYMNAVEAGDTETAQRMVDEAAKKNGYKKELYHGTNVIFHEFQEYGKNEIGFHVGTRKAAESRVQYELDKNIMRLYTKLGKNIQMPDVFGLWHGIYDYICYVMGDESDMIDRDFLLKEKKATAKFRNEDVFVKNDAFYNMREKTKEMWDDAIYTHGIKPSMIAKSVEAQREYMLSLGIDSIAYKNQYEDKGSKSYLLMHANQVKSADPVTYADDGNVIPLSERFNPVQEDIRYSITEADDREYMDAVEAGDTETAQRMVDEAARETGYNSPKLYHGTQNYGFTEFALNRMDDGQSIFLTDNRYVAESYSGTLLTGTPGGEGGRLVNGIRPERARTMPVEDAVQMYNELHEHDRGYEVLDSDGLERLIDREMTKVWKTAGAAHNLLNNTEWQNRIVGTLFSAEDFEEARQVLEAMDVFGDAATPEELDRAVDAYSRILGDVDLMNNQAVRTIMMMTDAFENLSNSPRFAARWMQMRGAGDDLVWNGSYDVMPASELREELYRDLTSVDEDTGARSGNYAVYAKYSNPLVIEAAERSWDDISFLPDELKRIRQRMKQIERANRGVVVNNTEWEALDRQFWDMADEMYDEYGINVNGGNTTREISAYAKAHGYDAVILRDVMDNGDQMYEEYASDVYILFDPNAVKSADPVTYDDRGYVIPISQRFNDRERDIRYSLADTPEAAGPIYSLPAKARDDALRVENALASSLAKMFGVNARHTTDEYKAFRTEVARPIIEAMLEGREVDPDRIFSENWNGSSILEAQGAREDLDDALTDAWRRVQQINAFAQEKASEESARAARNAEIDARIPDTTEGIIKMGETFKDAKRRRANVMARLLLTDEDLELARDVASGQMTEQEVYARRPFNYRDILEAAEAERAFRDADEVWGRYTRRIASRLIETADNLLEESDRWRDKGNGFAYARETAERNFRDVMGGDSGAMIDEYIRPIHKSEAESTRFKNDYIDRVKKLGLSRKIARGNQASESQAVQFLGEAEDNVRYLQSMRRSDAVRDGKTLDEWRAEIEAFRQANPNLDYDKVSRGIAEFQAIYGELITEMNRVLVENGYLPVNVRRGYFPHFNGGDDGILSKFANLLGINIDSQALPTAINGLTAGFKPGKAWFGHAQERTGFQTTYDAVEGFEGYIGGVSDVIHQTANIRKLRTLASRIRYRFGDEGIRNQINAIMANDTLDDNQKQVQIDDLTSKGRYKLSRFVAWLDEYTNLLANKKSKYDRGIEDLMGRRVYTWMKNIEGRVASNMISANLGSALTNFIPLNQAGAMLGDPAMLRGAFDTFAGRGRHDGFVNRSDFLTNRRGTDPLIQNRADKISEFLSSPMNIIDDFTSETIVRAAYGKYVRQGMDPDTAMQMADEFAAGVMADRSKGATPTIFSSHNPLTKLLTQFQVEVNNEFSTIFKDIPKGVHIPDREKKNMVAVAAWTLLRYFIGAYLFNDLYEKVVGRRAALDPIDILNDAVGDLTGKKLNNTIDALFTRDGIIEDVERQNPSDATQSLFENTAEELPFIGGLLGGGRIPISSAFPNFENINKAALNENWSTGKKAQVIGRELGGSIGTYILPPFAGGAAKKVIQTAENTLTGGRFVKNAEGEDQIQYPYFTDTPLDTAGTVAKSLLFGPTATEGGRDWVEGGFGNQTAKVTNLYRTLTDDLGESQRTAWDLIQTINSGEYGRDAQAKRYAIAQSDLSDEGKAAAMETYMSESEGRKFRGANQFGVSADAWAALYAGMDEFDANGNSTYTQEEMRDALEGIRVPVSYGEGATQGLFGGSMDDRSLTNREKAVLWAAYGYKKNGKSWKQSNNPYDPDLGERVIDWIEGLVYDADDEE